MGGLTRVQNTKSRMFVAFLILKIHFEISTLCFFYFSGAGCGGFANALVGKKPPAMQETQET